MHQPLSAGDDSELHLKDSLRTRPLKAPRLLYLRRKTQLAPANIDVLVKANVLDEPWRGSREYVSFIHSDIGKP